MSKRKSEVAKCWNDVKAEHWNDVKSSVSAGAVYVMTRMEDMEEYYVVMRTVVELLESPCKETDIRKECALIARGKKMEKVLKKMKDMEFILAVGGYLMLNLDYQIPEDE